MSDGILPDSITEPVHNDVMKAFFFVGFGSWTGGILAGSSDSLLGFAFGGVVMIVFATLAMMIIPHPTVLVDDWFAHEGVEDADQVGGGYE